MPFSSPAVRLRPPRGIAWAFHGKRIPIVRPARLAAAIALGYGVLCGAYILFSGRIASALADSEEALERIETGKGLLFIFVSALLLFGALSWLFRILAAHQRLVLLQEEALMSAEGRAAVGVVASSIGHDINNLLTVLACHIDLQSEDVPDHTMRRDAEEALSDLRDMAGRLMDAGKVERGKPPRSTDLVSIARGALDFARTHKMVQGCKSRLSAPSRMEMMGHPTMLRQMLVNLILNAARACPDEAGEFEIRVRRENGHVRLEVHDNGPGIPEEQRKDIFNAYYTRSQGRGLGLVSVQAYVNAHHGEIAIDRSPLGGACFRITLPERDPVCADAAA